MTREDKQLVFQDLCARLPYHVRCKVWLEDGTTEEGPLDLQHNYGDVLQDAFYYDRIKDIKPFLRPMSSMTEEERGEYYNVETNNSWERSSKRMDWLNEHHFDYRGLIDKGLALSTDEFNSYND